MGRREWQVFAKSAIGGSSLWFISGHASRESARKKAKRIVSNEPHEAHDAVLSRVYWNGASGLDDARTDRERAEDHEGFERSYR